MFVVCNELAGFTVIRVFFETLNCRNAGTHSKMQRAINAQPVMVAALAFNHLLSKGESFCNNRERKKKAT